MKKGEIKSMSTDELWALHEEIASLLTRKIADEKAKLDVRLRQLGAARPTNEVAHARRPYPKVFPKYRNPANPLETWAGRGKQPRWLKVHLQSGKNVDDFRIKSSSDRRSRSSKAGS